MDAGDEDAGGVEAGDGAEVEGAGAVLPLCSQTICRPNSPPICRQNPLVVVGK